jgi:malate dehydrogenase
MPVPIRVAITGAAARVAHALAFPIAAGGLFGPEQPVTLSLLDGPEQVDPLRALQMELQDCTFPVLREVTIDDQPRRGLEGANWVVLLGGEPRRTPAEGRIELLRRNASTFVEYGRAINEACPMARILVVANPSNTLCLIARSHARDVPVEHWFALTQLDRMRAISRIAREAAVSPDQVRGVTIWGDHSEHVYVDTRDARVGDRPLSQVIPDPSWGRDVLSTAVVGRSSEILELTGEAPAGTVAQAILSTIRSLITPTPPLRRFCAAVVSDGSYQVPKGLVFGFPLRTEDGRTWSILQRLYLDSYAQGRIAANVTALENESVIASELLGHQIVYSY